MSYQQERNRVFKMIWNLKPELPDMILKPDIPVSENRSVTNVRVHRNDRDDFDVTVTITCDDCRFKNFTRFHNTFLEAFTIVSRLTVYQDHALISMFDRLANAEPLSLISDSGPMRVFDHYPDGHISPYFDADTWQEAF